MYVIIFILQKKICKLYIGNYIFNVASKILRWFSESVALSLRNSLSLEMQLYMLFSIQLFGFAHGRMNTISIPEDQESRIKWSYEIQWKNKTINKNNNKATSYWRRCMTWKFTNTIFLFLERNSRVVWEGTSFNKTESKGNI